MSSDATTAERGSAELALGLIETLAGEIGPRRPTSRAEALAAEVIAERLRGHGLAPSIEPFPSYASFAYPYSAIAALALAPALLPKRWRLGRLALGATAAGLLAAEGELRSTPISAALARGESRNVVATIEPRGEAVRTLCLLGHSDTSRSGLIFHPALGPHLQPLFTAPSLAAIALAAAQLIEGHAAGRAVTRALRGILVATLLLLAEREFRGEDVPGANDNASGAATVVQLAAEVVAAPLESTRLVVLVPGSEEAGLLGARAFLDAHDTEGWLFVNFDGVGAPATLRYLPEEGIGRTWAADGALIEIAERIRRGQPELGLKPLDAPTGLTYDATVVLARGGRRSAWSPATAAASRTTTSPPTRPPTSITRRSHGRSRSAASWSRRSTAARQTRPRRARGGGEPARSRRAAPGRTPRGEPSRTPPIRSNIAPQRRRRSAYASHDRAVRDRARPRGRPPVREGAQGRTRRGWRSRSPGPLRRGCAGGNGSRLLSSRLSFSRAPG